MTTTTQAPDIVRLNAVTKRFTVRKDNSLKDRIVHFGRMGKEFRQDFVAVDGVSLEIRAGTTVGLLGANGSGKSTLLKLIGGIISPTTGTVRSRGRMAALLELGAGFHPDLSGRENVYLNASILGLSRQETDERFEEILEFSGIGSFIDTAVKFYSSGMYVRLAFAVAVHTDPDLLLVDEVLAVGDETFQRKCMDRIAQFRAEGRTIVLVSHSAQQVAELCDRGIVLSEGRIVHDGDTNEAIRALRTSLDLKRRKSTSASDAQPIHVTKIEVLDADGETADTIRSGDPVTIRVHAASVRRFDRWDVGFSIDTPFGHMVLASNTELLGRELPPLDGETTVDLKIESLSVGRGQYFINANVAGVSEISTHALMQGALLNVDGGEGTMGSSSAVISVPGSEERA
ncbi:ABC transporter ATP-binding protein [Microbacterium keratanolyticum]